MPQPAASRLRARPEHNNATTLSCPVPLLRKPKLINTSRNLFFVRDLVRWKSICYPSKGSRVPSPSPAPIRFCPELSSDVKGGVNMYRCAVAVQGECQGSVTSDSVSSSRLFVDCEVRRLGLTGGLEATTYLRTVPRARPQLPGTERRARGASLPERHPNGFAGATWVVAAVSPATVESHLSGWIKSPCRVPELIALRVRPGGRNLRSPTSPVPGPRRDGHSGVR